MTARRMLITGASRGIGYSLAERLAGLGHTPVGMARSAPAEFPGEFYEVNLADRRATDVALEKVRRLLAHLTAQPSARSAALAWSTWRRRHQHRAKLSHYQRRQAQIPLPPGRRELSSLQSGGQRKG